jgi:hypothetical protein
VSDLDYRKLHDDLIEKLMANMPEDWDIDASPETICVSYVRELERRLLAAGGSLDRWPGDD